MRKFIGRTVFAPIGDDWHPDKVMSVLFNRSAATLYLIYSIWGVATLVRTHESFFTAEGDIGRAIFATLLIPIALAGSFSALFFPRYARMEMYAAASIVSLVAMYEVVTFASFLMGSAPDGITFILILAHTVVPTSRLVFIYAMFVKQAGDK